MSIKLTRYFEYQQTRQEWLGQVPAHWVMAPHRAVFREIIDKGHPDEDMLSVTMQRGVIRQADLLRESSKKDSSNADKSNYKLVHHGDLAYNKMRAWQGALGVSRFRGIISPAYVVVRPRAAQNPEFYHYLMRTPAFMTEAERWSYGITSDQWSLRADDFKCIQTVIPPLEEQAAIVRFIRYIDQRVNRLLKTKRRLIELLNEQKQAIIHRAVTRGLDPDVPLKPSGVEWLGDVPEHWEVKRAKQLFQEVDSRSSSGTEVLLSLRMYLGLVPHNDVSKVPIPPKSLINFKQILPGQIVMNRMRAAIGMFGVATRSGLVSPDYAVFRPLAGVNPEYFVNVFKTRAAGDVFRIESKGLGTGASGFMRLYTDRFGITKLAVPPSNEQIAITSYIETETKEISKAQDRVAREIGLIREYRTRLVSDVVTGQLDVRGLALPEVDPESISLVDEGDELDEGADEGGEGAEE